MTCRAGRLGVGKELELEQESKVLELPKSRLAIQGTRGNQSRKESIREVV
jgi:hypothetical protein